MGLCRLLQIDLRPLNVLTTLAYLFHFEIGKGRLVVGMLYLEDILGRLTAYPEIESRCAQ